MIDTHCHLIYRNRLRYSWLEAVPELNRDFPVDEYLPQARAAGITTVLHMEVDVNEEDMDGETDLVASIDAVDGVIAACRPESAGFPAHLERLAARKKVRGLRRVLHVQPDGLAESARFGEHVRRLAAHGLAFDLCVLARQLPIAIALARRCPDVQFVLDHCGNPDIAHCGNPDIARRALDPWRADVRAIAALPNVACKVSGIVTNAPRDWTVEDLRPVVEHVIDEFGWDRVVWGSDWPVCTRAAALGHWVDATRRLLEGCSDDERTALLSSNARRVYRLS